MRQRNTSRKSNRTSSSTRSESKPSTGKRKTASSRNKEERSSSFKKGPKKDDPERNSPKRKTDKPFSPRGTKRSTSSPAQEERGKRGSFKKEFKRDRPNGPAPRRRESSKGAPDSSATERGTRRASSSSYDQGDKKRSSYKSEFKRDRPDSFSARKDSSDDTRKARGTKRPSAASRDDKKDERSSSFKRGIKRDRPDKNSSREESSKERPSASAREKRPISFQKDNEKRISFKKEGIRKSSRSTVSSENEGGAEEAPTTIRLNKYISNSGICSRREADNLITMGLVSVNGTTITELGYKVNRNDVVRYEDRVLTAEKPVYILMNKPKGFLTTTADPQERNTVMHLIGDAVKERIYPVGRLDRNTTGLLLLTNDGDLADKLTHPSFNVKKIYKVEIDKPLSAADFSKIKEGVRLEEGRAQVDDVAIVSDDGKTVGIELHIGWNRVVRRIFEELGYSVIKLDRVIYAGLDKKELPRGEWRFLKKGEIVKLKYFK